ncbi:glycoside hydrolase family 68 protein [Kineococcus sp. R8]|uniref:glycoside hydrolase family 68 protein n=1 Tax=Kineococcus siccus TaxID=2696567 RepID=UPI0014130D0B|nr:glycoside hydrolase family 68 protein [Kineococcus siccus]NAZ82388.1 glycoside hydrolase family 68 protein [Kineococcus siccus]
MTRRRTPLALAVSTALLFTGAHAAAAAPEPPRPVTTKAVLDPRAEYTANWTRGQALEIATDETNATPLIPTSFPTMTDEVWVWDTWPLTDLEGNPVSYNGYNVIFSLTAPREGLFFGDRHWQARIGYFFSKNGRDWTYGGHLFPDDASFGLREWAGSTVLTEDDEIHTFYTASGSDDSPPTIPLPGGGYGANNGDPLQRLAHAAGTIATDDDGVFFRGFDDHQIVAEADGELYQTMEQSMAGPIIYAFRDPFVFRDPVDGEIYALFEGNNAGVAGSHTCDPAEIGDVPAGHEVPADARFYTGNIGLMHLDDVDDELDGEAEQDWTLLPPLLSAECVNQQTERPHLVIRDGQYYLWTISHQFTFAPGLTGPDGLYGFVGDGLRSDYRPLNGSALVLGNPEDAPLQNYSHFVMPNLLVESFIDTIPGPDGPVYGGTLAPTLQLEVFGEDGDQTRLDGVLPYGYIPATRAVGSAT